MLKQRVITACCLAGLLLWAVLGWSKIPFSALLAVVALLSLWEWARLCGLHAPIARLCYCLPAGGITLLALHPAAQQPLATAWIGATGFAAWCAIIAYLLAAPPLAPLAHRRSIGRMALAPALFFIAIWGLVWLRHSDSGGPLLFLYVFCTVWLADIGAYFAGRRWGKHLLAPTISPGKTHEGVAGGLLAVLIWALLFVALGSLAVSAGALLAASLLAALFSIGGDLFESAMKRSAGVKDSGTLLPGHGGVLDRIDSLIAAVPVFVFVLSVKL